jgi:hypothetical protein
MLAQQLSLFGPQLVIPAPPATQLGFDAPRVEPEHAPAEQVPVAQDHGLPQPPSEEHTSTWVALAHRVVPGTHASACAIPSMPPGEPPDDPLLADPEPELPLEPELLLEPDPLPPLEDGDAASPLLPLELDPLKQPAEKPTAMTTAVRRQRNRFFAAVAMDLDPLRRKRHKRGNYATSTARAR